MPSNFKNHAVWDVYDELRTACLNVKCLSCEIARVRRWSTAIEVILALSGASSIGAVAWLQKNLRYDPLRDFVPVTVAGENSLVLVTNPSLTGSDTDTNTIHVNGTQPATATDPPIGQ